MDYVIDSQGGGIKTMTVWDNADSQSWAVVDWVRTSSEWLVRESGPRSPWAEVEATYDTWARLGEPSPDAYVVQVDEGRIKVLLGDLVVASLMRPKIEA